MEIRSNAESRVLRSKGRTSTNRATAIFFALVYPFGALLLAFRNRRSPISWRALWFFVIYFGFTMVISNEKMDAFRYKEVFLEWAKSNTSLYKVIGLLYSKNSEYLDIVEPMISFIVSRFTVMPMFLFAAYGLVFGYFYAKNIWFLLDRIESRIKPSVYIYLFTFAFIIGFWQINGFRMWTAAHVFFFGAIRYIMNSDRKGILVASLSILFHFSFILPVLILVGFFLYKIKPVFAYWFYIASFVFAEINLGQVQGSLLSFLPEIFHGKVQEYTNYEYFDVRQGELEHRNWRFFIYNEIVKYVSLFYLSLIYFKGKSFLKSNKQLIYLFSFALLFIAIANFASSVPSGARFRLVGYLFAFFLIILYKQSTRKTTFTNLTNPIITVFLLLFCLGMLNTSFLTSNIMLYLGNPVAYFVTGIEVPISSFIE